MEVNINPEYWLNRRTIRQYTDRPVSRELINDLLAKAAHAPTTGNMQLYSVVASWADDERLALAPLHFNQPQVMGCQVVLTFCADLHRYTRWCESCGADAAADNLQFFMAALLDTALAAQQFNTLAEGAGLGVCMLGTTTYNAAEIARELALPPLVIPVITLTVGYPANDGAETGRLPLGAWLHDGKYNDYTPEELDTLYYEKEHREDSRQWVAENALENLAQVFARCRYPRANSEAFSAKFEEVLKASGLI